MKKLILVVIIAVSLPVLADNIPIVTSISLQDLENFEEVGGVRCGAGTATFGGGADYPVAAKKCREDLREQARKMGATLIGLEASSQSTGWSIVSFVGTAYRPK
jgi:hypothetical protein